MGVLSLHNECPPLGFGNDTKAICQGLVIGEEGTSAMLKAMADGLLALAAMDDTVGAVVAQWSEGPNGDQNGVTVQQNFKHSFDALTHTVNRIDIALQKYHELRAYARSALEAGRGKSFQAALVKTAGEDFDTLVGRRIELLRKLKVRVKVLQQLEFVGVRTLESFDYSEFFLLFMQPIRDMAIAINELYSEVVRGALASHRAFFQTCRLLGENAVMESPSIFVESQAVGTKNAG